MLPEAYDELFGLVFGHIYDVVFVIDVGPCECFRFVSVNRRFLDATGLQESQVVGKLIQDVIPEASHALVLEKYRQAIEGKEPVHWLEVSVYPAGEKTGEVTVVPVFDAQGRCTQLVGTVHDVSEHVHSRDELRKLNAHLQRMTQLYAALSECNQMIIRCHSESELFERICRIVVEHGGMKMAWVGRENPSDHWVKPVASFGTGTDYLERIRISTDADSPYGNGPTGTAMRTHEPFWCVDFQHDPKLSPWRALGKRFGWRSAASLPLYCKGAVAGSLNLYSEESGPFDENMKTLLLEMAEDISYALGHLLDEAERSKEQAQLHMLSEVLKQSPSVVIMTDLDDAIEYANPAFVDRYGYALREIIGQSIRLLQSEASGHARFDEIHASLEQSGRWTGELVNVAKDGREYIESTTAAIIHDSDGRPIKHVYAFRNITEQKHHEQERQKLSTQLQHIQKMESIGRLAGGIAHDFNNMLGVIIAYSELALRQMTDEKLIGYLKEISKAADRSANLTRQLLTFARKQASVPKSIDPNQAVENMFKMLQRLIGEDIVLDWLPGEQIWPINIDPSQLDQILANLCVNARDAIEGGGRIMIETRNETLDVDYCIFHPEAAPGDYVRLSVSDNGCGIEKEYLGSIFEPFFTTKQVGEGTGLGLSTVYGIVEQNKGFINVYSEPGHGTMFNIYLHRHGGSMQADKKVRGGFYARGHEHILLVEDEAAILEVIRSVLESCGYTVLSAQSPEEAKHIAREHAGEINMLVTDMIMPGMNGRELAQTLSSIQPGMRCLFMSGYSGDTIAHQGILKDGIHFIQKPFSLAAMAAKVREILDE